MNIATIGPAGYRFQDLACIELALRFAHKDNIQMFIESSEDAKLIYGDAGIQKTIEVQVKQSKDDLSLEYLSEILAHFSPLSTTDFLLKRVAENNATSGMIIIGGRCLDATRAYLQANWDGTPHENSFLKLDEVENLKRQLELVKDKAVTLQVERGISVKEFANKQKKQQFKICLRKIAVEEQVFEEKLNQICKKHLFDRYRIPTDVADTVITELREKVTTAKNPAIDFIPLFQSTIKKFSNRIKRKKYIARGEESVWSISLSTHNVLLLSGPPKCGKTSAAHHYIEKLAEDNYAVEIGNDVRTAERYLSMDVPQSRAYILEDPLGGISKAANATDSLAHLQRMMDFLGSNRKLIITQRQDILLEATGNTTLSGCSLNGITWHNLNTNNKLFLKAAWQEFSDEADVKQSVHDLVIQMLEDGEEIEVGSLRHLANTSDRLGDAPSAQEILKAARREAEYIAADFGHSQPGASLLSTFAFTTGPTVSVGENELEFILEANDTSLPGYRLKENLGTFYGSSEDGDDPEPIYPNVSKLTPEFQEYLDSLEQRRFVEYSSSNYNFTHPFYRAAGQASVRANIRSRRENLIRNIRRAVYCLSGNTSSTAILSFDWILEENKDDKQITRALVSLAIEAFQHTLFVRTQQNCYRFLLNHLLVLEPAEAAKMPEFSQRLSSVESSDIRWIGSEAAFYWGHSQDGLRQYLKSYGADIDETDMTPLAGRNYTTEQTLNYILGLARHPHLLTKEDTLLLLNYDESIIRAQAAQAWFKLNRDDDEEVIEKIFSDDQPNVLVRALQSLIDFSHIILDSRMALITKNLKQALESPFLANAALYRIDLFVDEDDFSPRSKRPEKYDNRWVIFSAIAPVMLAKAPDSTRVVPSRFSECMTETLQSSIPAEDKINTIYGWLRWLERNANSAIPLDDWITRIIEDVLEYTPNSNPNRLDILKKYSQLIGTQYRLIFLQEMSRCWKSLTESELRLLYDVLTSANADFDWKLATVILNSDDALQEHLASIGRAEGRIFNFAPDCDSPTYKLMIVLLCGLSQSARRAGVAPFSRDKWVKVLEKIARDPTHAFFIEAFEYLRTNYIEIINESLLDGFSIDKEAIIDVLWRSEVQLSGLWNQPGWIMIYNAAASEEREEMVETLSFNVHAFIENIRELELCFGTELAGDIFMQTHDYIILEMFPQEFFSEYADHENIDTREKFRTAFESLLTQAHLFPENYSLIARWIEKFSYPWEEFKSKLEKLRLESYKIARTKREKVSFNTLLSQADEHALGWLND